MRIATDPCASKRTYFTKAAVNKALRESKRKSDTPLYYYRCPNCGNYHLTKMSPADYLQRQQKRRYMFQKLDGLYKKERVASRRIAQVNGVTAVITIFRLLDEADAERVYGCRVFTGDPDAGPYHSAITDLYYDERGALFESVGIATAMGANPIEWLTAVGLSGVTVTQ